MAPEKRGEKQEGRFRPGRSGNPNGRPKGTRNRTTVMLEQMLDGQAQQILQTAITRAVTIGDPVCVKLCLERLLPVRKERPAVFRLPEVDSANGVASAFTAILRSVAKGEIEVSQGVQVAQMLEGCRRTIELAELEARLNRLEEVAEANNGKA